MKRRRSAAAKAVAAGFAAGVAAALLSAAPATASECHVALALALDASDSVDPVEADLQREGVAFALSDPEVMDALSPSPDRVALVMVFEWADPGETQVLARWTRLDGPDTIAALAARIRSAPSVYMSGQTGIGAALEFAVEAHRNAPLACARKVIDVSGDGPGNIGPAPDRFRDEGVFDDIMINGLVIRQDPADYAQQQPSRDPLPYYEAEVRHGAGAFVVIANDYEDYADALRRKLLRELQPILAEAHGAPAR